MFPDIGVITFVALWLAWMCDECTWHHKTFLAQWYRHLAISCIIRYLTADKIVLIWTVWLQTLCWFTVWLLTTSCWLAVSLQRTCCFTVSLPIHYMTADNIIWCTADNIRLIPWLCATSCLYSLSDCKQHHDYSLSDCKEHHDYSLSDCKQHHAYSLPNCRQHHAYSL